jgi:hypothetical protein
VDLESDGTPEARQAGRQVPWKIAEAVGDMKVSTEQHRGTELGRLRRFLHSDNHEMSCEVPYTRGSNSCLEVPDEVET